MKKALIMILMFSLMFIVSIDLKAANGQNNMIQTSNTVSFANEDYIVLRPKLLTETIYSRIYEEGFYYYTIAETINLSIINNQVQYADIYDYFYNGHYNSMPHFEIYNSLLINADYQYVSYAFEWYYTFSIPSYVIVNVGSNGWYQVSSVPVGSIYFSIVYGDVTNNVVENYLGFYDVLGNTIPNTSGFFSGNYIDDNRVGLAFLPSTKSDIAIAYARGFEQGVFKGYVDGVIYGKQEGYENARLIFGYELNDVWLTAAEWGAVRYNDGLNQDLFGNLFDVFIALIILIGSVFDTTIFPGVTLGMLWFIPIAFAVFKFFIKKV